MLRTYVNLGGRGLGNCELRGDLGSSRGELDAQANRRQESTHPGRYNPVRVFQARQGKVPPVLAHQHVACGEHVASVAPQRTSEGNHGSRRMCSSFSSVLKKT